MSPPTPVAYTLTPPSPPAPPAPPPVAVISTAILSSTIPAFLGSGLLRPFVRDQKNDFANGNGLAVIQACVGQVLGTKASDDSGRVQGELRWRPTFGCKLYLLQHRKGPHLAQLAAHYVREALARWEPRVTNVQVTSAFFPSQLALELDLLYDVIARNVPGNRVLFAGVSQTVTASL